MIASLPTVAAGPSLAQFALAQSHMSFLPSGFGRLDRAAIGEERLESFSQEMNRSLDARDGQLVSLGGTGFAWLFRMGSDPQGMLRLLQRSDAVLSHDFTVYDRLAPSERCPSLIVAHAPTEKDTAASRLFLSITHLSEVTFPEWVYFEVRRDISSVRASLVLLLGSLHLFNPHAREALFTTVDELPFSKLTQKTLQNVNIKYVGELLQKTERDLRAARGIGPKALNEIRQVLAERGWTLGTDLTGLWP